MAASAEPEFRFRGEDTSDGHNIHYSFPMRELFHRQSDTYVAIFDVKCAVRPTSWSLAVTCKQGPETGEMVCFCSITRRDRMMEIMKASLEVGLLDCRNHYVVFPRLLRTKHMFHDEQLSGTFVSKIPAGYINSAMSQDLILEVSILIRTCHFTEDCNSQKCFTKAMGDMGSSKTK